MKTFLKIIITFKILYFNSISAQQMKYYIEQNDILIPITKEVFDEKDRWMYTEAYRQNETETATILYLRRHQGKLDNGKLELLKQHLKEMSGARVVENNYIIINYITSFPKIKRGDRKSEWYITDKDYNERQRKKTPNIYFVYNPEQKHAVKHFGRKYISVYPDKENKILNVLFPAQGKYSNVAVIKADGTFATYIGGHSPHEIDELLMLLGIKT